MAYTDHSTALELTGQSYTVIGWKLGFILMKLFRKIACNVITRLVLTFWIAKFLIIKYYTFWLPQTRD